MLPVIDFITAILEPCAPYILYAAKDPIVMAIIIGGYWLVNQKVFLRSLEVICFTLVIGFFLKCFWKAPLPPGVASKTWAFPSGHMLWACLFWGYLAFSQRRVWLRSFAVVFLAIYGCCIVIKGFHYPRDIWGAVGFAIPILAGIKRLEEVIWVKQLPHRFALVLWLLAIPALMGTVMMAWLRSDVFAGFVGLLTLVACHKVRAIPDIQANLSWSRRTIGFFLSLGAVAMTMLVIVPGTLTQLTNAIVAEGIGFGITAILLTVLIPRLVSVRHA